VPEQNTTIAQAARLLASRTPASLIFQQVYDKLAPLAESESNLTPDECTLIAAHISLQPIESGHRTATLGV
jgi:hypothetical protein